MQKEAEWLYRLSDSSDTESPRECHLQALMSTFKGESIPEHVYNAVLGSAERNRERLKTVMDNINLFVQRGVGKETAVINIITLTGTIAATGGIDGPKAYHRRVHKLTKYFQGFLLTEETGPTE